MSLTVRSRQKTHPVDAWLLRRLAKWVLEITEPDTAKRPSGHELGVFLVGPEEMALINYSSLLHEGPTDVITFDYCEQGDAPKPGPILGDLFICTTVAEEFAGEFGTTWPEEVARYLIHGVLHLRGYDDRDAATRKAMKREENRLMEEAKNRFPLSRLAKRPITDVG